MSVGRSLQARLIKGRNVAFIEYSDELQVPYRDAQSSN